MKANASFWFSYNNYGGYYRVRFNKLAAVLFDGVDRVRMTRTEDYLIFTPASGDGEDIFPTRKDPGGGIRICLNRAVDHGMLHKSMFDSSHYCVKRGSKTNKIYVCLKEGLDEKKDNRRP